MLKFKLKFPQKKKTEKFIMKNNNFYFYLRLTCSKCDTRHVM